MAVHARPIIGVGESGPMVSPTGISSFGVWARAKMRSDSIQIFAGESRSRSHRSLRHGGCEIRTDVQTPVAAWLFSGWSWRQ